MESRGNKKDAAKKFLKKDHHDSSNMIVAIRIRPLSNQEQEKKEFEIIRAEDKLLIVMDKNEMECEMEQKKLDVLHRSREQRYYFDRIFNNKATTQQVYEKTAQGQIDSVIRGYNACVFAYGTTGSGKTYTMTGTQASPGIMYLIIEDMFRKIKDITDKSFDIRVSYVEIYNEVIRDLLVVDSHNTHLDLRDDHVRGVVLSGVTEFAVAEPQEVMDLLISGNKRRTTESTKANLTSSRSHAICQIQLAVKDKTKNTEEEVLCGKLSLVDLAGSERGTVTENRGIRLMEGARINTSLLALANCINALGDKTKKGSFVPFRDSKLTRMLKDSLGGNSKTVMIATVSPASAQNEETINTLKYANRAKNIKMRVEQNKKMVHLHISAYKNIITGLRDEIETLKSQLNQDMISKSFMPTKTQQASEFKKHYQKEAQRIMEEEDAKIDTSKCKCESRTRDDHEKKKIQNEIQIVYEEIIQLEQALIELDEQNTINAMEIRKREAKAFLMTKQIEDIEEQLEGAAKENPGETDVVQLEQERQTLVKSINQQQEQIVILNESTKQNLVKRHSMKQDLYTNYQNIRNIRDSIESRIENDDIKDYLELVIKNNFLESQNVQLLLNLQLQARTIIDLKNMITKQQKFIEDNDIVGNLNQDKNLEIFLDDGLNLDDENDDQINPDPQTDGEGPPNNYESQGSNKMTKNAPVRQSFNKQETAADLQINGIPVSQRQGNGHNSKKASIANDGGLKEQRGLRSKNAKEIKEQKERQDGDFKQSIEGLSIVGTGQNRGFKK